VEGQELHGVRHSASRLLGLTVALTVLAHAPAQAAQSLSTTDAARAIERAAAKRGVAEPKALKCRRLNATRVVCELSVRLADGSPGRDRYVAFRTSMGRVRVQHRPLRPPGLL
jgi:4-hydroxyphenylpyruvate dioxygenase-like putative hemolysin